MFKTILVLLITLSNLPSITPSCVALYGQCGGLTYNGSTNCCSPATCQYNSAYYSQCLTGTTPATTQSASTPSPASTTLASTGCNALYSQCGGQNWSGWTCCINSTCVKSSEYYSQCLQNSSNSAQSTTVSASTTQSTASTTKAPSSTTQSTASTTKAPSSTTQSTASTTKAPSSTTQSTASTTKAPSSTTQSTASTTKAPSSTTQSTASTTNAPVQGCSSTYGQCGGTGWTGPTCCNSGSTCQYSNPYYSQCIPATGASTSSSNTASASTTSVTDNGRVNGVTTRYWDCCKASCGWPGKASVTSPVETCASDGITVVDPNTQSGCDGGTAYMCNNQQPWNVSSTLSYGYAAAYISGEGESDWCCACYSLIFTTGPVVGKELIVQVTNTGSDLGSNQFDLQMPGGGVGIFNGCSSQFPGSYSWGQQYGGVSQRSDCNNLPPVLQSGCFWRFDWFMNANNPAMSFKQVTCPTALTSNTQCIRH